MSAMVLVIHHPYVHKLQEQKTREMDNIVCSREAGPEAEDPRKRRKGKAHR